MKKAIVIFFCLQVISGNSFGMELFKLPLLVQHYFEHEKKDHPDLGFGQFLWEHYMEDDEHADEQDSHCHEKLPFKHCHDCCTHHTGVTVFTLPENPVSISIPANETVAVKVGQDQFLSFYQCCIWQPPQLV